MDAVEYERDAGADGRKRSPQRAKRTRGINEDFKKQDSQLIPQMNTELEKNELQRQKQACGGSTT